MMRVLVLSLFSGFGFLDKMFAEEGFCVVRGPDLLWGEDVRGWHAPAGKFTGVIGGPPCQEWTDLVFLNRAQGVSSKHGDQIPEFERIVAETQPDWFLMENAPLSPAAKVEGYRVHDQILKDAWVGGETRRERRFSFGTRAGLRLDIATLALHRPDPERAITGDARLGSVGERVRRKDKGIRGGPAPNEGRCMPLPDMLRLQGYPLDIFTDDSPFTLKAKRQMVGNGVPYAMGRAVARAVKAALQQAAPRAGDGSR